MRLFIAIDLPNEAKEALIKAQKQIPKCKISLAKDFHITLKFLREVSTDKTEELKEKLQKAKFKPFETKLDSIGFFPSEKYIRVVWAGINPEEETLQLQKEINNLIGNDYPDDYKFSPHITLARVKFVGDNKGLVEQLKKINLEKINIRVDSFKLKKSILRGKEGPVYEDIEAFELKDL